MSPLAQQLGLGSKPCVGISQCLMGEKVRYDGDDKYHPATQGCLKLLFDLKPFCPEMAIGLPAPRPPVKLINNEHGAIHVIEPKTQKDYTKALTDAAKHYQQNQPLSGFILTTKSPSCGLKSTKLYNPQGKIIGFTSGIFARKLDPGLALIEDCELEQQEPLGLFIQHAYSRHYQDICQQYELSLQALTATIQRWLDENLQTLLQAKQ